MGKKEILNFLKDNPSEFLETCCGIKLFPYQKFWLKILMNNSNVANKSHMTNYRNPYLYRNTYLYLHNLLYNNENQGDNNTTS